MVSGSSKDRSRKAEETIKEREYSKNESGTIHTEVITQDAEKALESMTLLSGIHGTVLPSSRVLSVNQMESYSIFDATTATRCEDFIPESNQCMEILTETMGIANFSLSQSN